MVVLVTGANGQLGRALQFISHNYAGIAFHFADSREADITDKENLQRIFARLKPDYCINAAAYTAVDKAESEPQKAHAINVDGARNLARICNEFQTELIHISTDFVFDGTKRTPYIETDATNPQGVYAQTKLDGEHAIIDATAHYFIIRTSWVYSKFGNNFMKTMLRLATERTSLNVVDDQIGTPTNAVDLAEAILQIIESGKKTYGIYHFSNGGIISWYDFAREIFSLNGVEIELNPIPTSAYPTPAKRPGYSVLDKGKITQTFGIEIRDWKASLKAT
jgi:dTDP-4-dehydrorhamnose reductase